MKISELIGRLEVAKEDYGDLELGIVAIGLEQWVKNIEKLDLIERGYNNTVDPTEVLE